MKRILSAGVLLFSTLLCAEDVVHQDGWGVELNPFRLLILAGDGTDWTSFSGTLSHFNNETGVEIAIPFVYAKDTSTRYYFDGLRGGEGYEDKGVALDVDLHYRQYFSKSRTEGAYLGAFGRYTYLDGRSNNHGQYATVEKFGVGGELGFKMKNLFDTPFYWGASLSLGVYLGNDNNVFQTSDMSLDVFDLDDNKYIIDVELLKVGYEF